MEFPATAAAANAAWPSLMAEREIETTKQLRARPKLLF
jgi:hypothetical protein